MFEKQQVHSHSIKSKTRRQALVAAAPEPVLWLEYSIFPPQLFIRAGEVTLLLSHWSTGGCDMLVTFLWVDKDTSVLASSLERAEGQHISLLCGRRMETGLKLPQCLCPLLTFPHQQPTGPASPVQGRVKFT